MKIVKNALYLLGFSVMLAAPVHAYLDPAVTSLGIQVIAGVAVAAGAVIGILWRRAKKKVQEKMGIDEQSKKEVEEDVEFDEI